VTLPFPFSFTIEVPMAVGTSGCRHKPMIVVWDEVLKRGYLPFPDCHGMPNAFIHSIFGCKGMSCCEFTKQFTITERSERVRLQ